MPQLICIELIFCGHVFMSVYSLQYLTIQLFVLLLLMVVIWSKMRKMVNMLQYCNVGKRFRFRFVFLFSFSKTKKRKENNTTLDCTNLKQSVNVFRSY